MTEDRAPADLRAATAPSSGDGGPPVDATCDRELVVTARDGAVTFLAPADPSPVAALDLLVETVCDLLEVDYAGVHLVQDDEHHVLAGSDPTFRAPRPRNDSLCGVLLERHVRPRPADAPPLAQVIEVRDTAEDPTLPQLVHGVNDSAPVRFYAAAPLYDLGGQPLGTLCVISHHPRTLSGAERRTLLLLGVAASTVLVRCRAARSAPALDG